MSSATLAPTQVLDYDKAGAFAMRLVGDTTAIAMGVLQLVGDRLGLFDTLAVTGPVTSDAFARSARINVRYAKEWLSGMACHRYASYDHASETFWLSPEQQACLVDRDSPFYLGSGVRMIAEYWNNADKLVDVFQNGGGIHQDHFGPEWSCGFERFSRPAFLNNLCAHWIPAMPEIDARLRAGGSVADIGCGNGQALIELAKGYPEARLIGFDLHAPAIENARANAAAAGIGSNLRFEVLDASAGIPGSFDLITCFDVVHDMPHPLPALRQIRQALNPGGGFFAMEFNLADDLQGNIDHPLGLGAFGYAASVNYCMTTSLAAGGEGIGTVLGEKGFRAFAAEAGFGQVRRLDFPTNPFCIFFEATV